MDVVVCVVGVWRSTGLARRDLKGQRTGQFCCTRDVMWLLHGVD